MTDAGTLCFNIAIEELDPIFVTRSAGGNDRLFFHAGDESLTERNREVQFCFCHRLRQVEPFVGWRRLRKAMGQIFGGSRFKEEHLSWSSTASLRAGVCFFDSAIRNHTTDCRESLRGLDNHHTFAAKVFSGSVFSTMVAASNSTTTRALHIQALALSVCGSNSCRTEGIFQAPPKPFTTAPPLMCSRHRRSAGTGLPQPPRQSRW